MVHRLGLTKRFGHFQRISDRQDKQRVGIQLAENRQPKRNQATHSRILDYKKRRLLKFFLDDRNHFCDVILAKP